MSLSFNFDQIKWFLSLPESNKDLETFFSEWNTSIEFQQQIIDKLLSYINHFTMFRDIKPMMNSVFIIIKKTLEFKPDIIKEFEQLLIKNTLMRFIQEYITYSKISAKEQVLNYLTQSLQKLKLQPLIINLGLLIKPMYKDEEYLKKIKGFEEVEVSYILNSNQEVEIKKAIDIWIETQNITLNDQNNLKIRLKSVYDDLINNCDLSSNSELCNKLWLEVMEMLNLKLAVLSLMESIQGEGIEPVGIK
ncbi:MAG: hypothetical protein KGD63_02595 [Candidatus Lokiarchaeota archaeon]|nr:hypothetical protein [Candidatus Lokiarchaeota archaeon]